MNDTDYPGFVSAMGEEFADVLRSVSGDVCGVDVFTVITGVIPSRLSPKLLAGISSEQVEHLRAGFSRYFEVADGAVTTEQITTAISRTLRRWPANQSDDDTESA
jgi:hypothetical protein